MFINAILVATDGGKVRGGVDADWVVAVFQDHSIFFDYPTQFLVSECDEERVAAMTLNDVWVDLCAFHPSFLPRIPRPDGRVR